MQKKDVLVVGGGASGFFTAINIAEQNPQLSITILERGKNVLEKVRISGGGRCNVTHACYVPDVLTKFYPRGERELKGPFHVFATGDMESWLEGHGVTLKTEEDGRMFPESNSSQTIIDCFLNLAHELGIQTVTSCNVQSLKFENESWIVSTTKDEYASTHLVMATGSNPKIWEIVKNLGHRIVAPVPSLFTFNCKDERINQLMGVSVPMVSIKVKNTSLKSSGPLLITHWGLSGPAILRLSAWGARILSELNYRFQIMINWTHDLTFDQVFSELQVYKKEHSKKTILKHPKYGLTHRLWQQIVKASGIAEELIWAEITKKQIVKLAEQLTLAEFQIQGKSTFKDEFVTAGGVELKEINFKTMESKLHQNLYFTGEIVNIDAITGGFNFQNAWTTGYIAAQTIYTKEL